MFYRIVKGNRAVEVWTTTCIVTNFGKPPSPVACTTLINPSNPELSGVKNFPYFPRGGPVPEQKPTSMHKDWQPLGYVSNWGGMQVGSGMMYAVSVVDGLVHQTGGWKLQAECQWHRMTCALASSLSSPRASGAPCPVGTAVQTSAGNDTLALAYDSIVHATPPFFQHDSQPEEQLQRCYESALKLAWNDKAGSRRVATPLLGSGARGFPHETAMQVASSVCVQWMENNAAATADAATITNANADAVGTNSSRSRSNTSDATAAAAFLFDDDDDKVEQTIVFGLLEKEWALRLSEMIEQKMKDTTVSQTSR